MRASVAGMRYAAIVFAIGCLLGVVRVFVTAPRIGELAATALELPVMLAAAWLVCGAVLRRCAVPGKWRARASMGVLAFGLLMAAELALGVFGFGQSPGTVLAGYARPAPQLGLAGQLLFAVFPLLRR